MPSISRLTYSLGRSTRKILDLREPHPGALGRARRKHENR